MQFGPESLLPPLVAIVFAIATRKVVLPLAAGVLMKPEPMIPFENEDQRDFYDSYTSNRQRTLRDLKRRFSTLDRRLRRMEDKVTSRDFEWQQKFNG